MVLITPYFNNFVLICFVFILGVHSLHSKRVCHRNLCLENVVLSGDNIVKIIDFGVAKRYLESNETFQTKDKMWVGHGYCCSPEVRFENFTYVHLRGRAALRRPMLKIDSLIRGHLIFYNVLFFFETEKIFIKKLRVR